MKFINYGIPTGLGIKEFNTNTNLNGITNMNINITKNVQEIIQLGGGHHNISYLPCETVFYVFEHPITFPEVENVELTDDEELSEEIELSKIKQSKLIGGIDTSSESSIKSNLKKAIDSMVENTKNADPNPSIKRDKIVSLKGLFSQNENDEDFRDTSYQTSHSSLKSILRTLKDSKNTAR